MDNITLAKTAVKLTVGFGTSKIFSSIVRNNVVINTPTEKVAVVAASFVIGQKAAEVLGEFTDAKIDAAAAWYEKRIQKNA